MRNIKLTLQYDGTDYFGWQRQKNTHQTIAEIIENVLNKILQGKFKLIAAGRTDTGVHAKGQVANFITGSKMSLTRLRQSLNALLPKDIRVIKVEQAPADFHSRYSAKAKTYRYTILNSYSSDVFLRRYVCHYPLSRLDVQAMRKAGTILVGNHDFLSFKRTDKKTRSTVRDLKEIKITKKGKFIYIDVTANSFLYHMVRNIAGTLIEIGKGSFPPENLKNILKAKDRRTAGPTAPACGLCLMKVKY
ncbi:MAG: tRNA pseudouridine(38-40) synthase TruA [Candidatus Omnitrophica bacterium]|nr:tRNA pseudouridine(38-40) synthase TruA [Candidatus Omnitrophota bacterium]